MDPSTIMGAISLGSALMGGSSQKKAQKKQEQLQERQVQLSEEQYYQQQLDRQEWKDMYGGMEENLLHYVKGLDASKIYATQEGSMRKAFDRSRDNTTAYLAERGFDVMGGVGADMFADLSVREAEAEVALRQKSEEYVINTQQGLLRGNPKPANADPSNVNRALQGQQQLAGQKGAYEEKQFDALAQFAGQMAGGMSGGKSMGQAMGDIFNSNNGYRGKS